MERIDSSAPSRRRRHRRSRRGRRSRLRDRGIRGIAPNHRRRSQLAVGRLVRSVDGPCPLGRPGGRRRRTARCSRPTMEGGTWAQSSGVPGGATPRSQAPRARPCSLGTGARKALSIHQPRHASPEVGCEAARRRDHLDRDVRRLRRGPHGVGVDVARRVPVIRSRRELLEDQQRADDHSDQA